MRREHSIFGRLGESLTSSEDYRIPIWIPMLWILVTLYPREDVRCLYSLVKTTSGSSRPYIPVGYLSMAFDHVSLALFSACYHDGVIPFDSSSYLRHHRYDLQLRCRSWPLQALPSRWMPKSVSRARVKWAQQSLDFWIPVLWIKS